MGEMSERVPNRRCEKAHGTFLYQNWDIRYIFVLDQMDRPGRFSSIVG